MNTFPKMSGSVSMPKSLSGNVGAKTINIGEKGDDGATFIPTVSNDGVISWSNDKDLPNPEPVNIKGVKGDKGDAGAPGADGVSCTHEWDGATLIVTSASGTSSADLKGEKGDKGDPGQAGADGQPGKDGQDGADGYTPIKGTDYWTDTDKAAIVQDVLAALPVYTGEVEDV